MLFKRIHTLNNSKQEFFIDYETKGGKRTK